MSRRGNGSSGQHVLGAASLSERRDYGELGRAHSRLSATLRLHQEGSEHRRRIGPRPPRGGGIAGANSTRSRSARQGSRRNAVAAAGSSSRELFMKITLSEPYAAREIRFLELWTPTGWKIKCYGIAHPKRCMPNVI